MISGWCGDRHHEPRAIPDYGGVIEPPGGVIRHDAVARATHAPATAWMFKIHPYTESDGAFEWKRDARQRLYYARRCRCWGGTNVTAGWASTISNMGGVPLPIVSDQLQACVTEPW